ncbi:MAG TPA: Fe-S cluster assembly protein SufD [Dehalococcoidia bacterium]|nr:Fe-S cluster assembly protein SufD [Dehalococcoidia bacterium]
MTQEVLSPGITGITERDVETVAASEPAWLQEQRRAAWRTYESMDLPDIYDEEWRRTDVRALPLDGLHRASPQTDITLTDEAKAAGVIFAPLASALRDVPAGVRERLYSVVKPDEWKYLALNAALWDGGALLYVPKGVELTEPLHLLTTGPRDESAALFTRTLVVAEAHSRVALIDESTSPDGQRTFVSDAIEIVLGDGAKLDYYDVNRWGDGAYNFKTVRAVLGRDAEFTALAAGIGSKLTKMRIDTEMPQPGARAQLLGVTFGNGDQHFDYNTLQNHVGNHTISDLQFKSAMTDSSSLVWYGITRINPTAGGSEANQTSRNMLLSDHAKAAPIPILEIEAWDVTKCSHGATAGPVDENELFYLEARAIPREVAQQMLVEGFFADVIVRIPNEELRARVSDAIVAKSGGDQATLSPEEVLSA